MSFGPLIMAAFSNAATFTPVTNTYTTGGSSGSDTIPTGASQVVIECWGAGGGGGCYWGATMQGGGGGGYSKSTYSISSGDWGKTIGYNVGQYGYNGGCTFAAQPGGYSSAQSGTFTITAMAANGGDGGYGYLGTSNTGAGGTAGGGTDSNLTGGTGGFPTAGAAAQGGIGDGGIGGTSATGGNGEVGRVRFSYT